MQGPGFSEMKSQVQSEVDAADVELVMETPGLYRRKLVCLVGTPIFQRRSSEHRPAKLKLDFIQYLSRPDCRDYRDRSNVFSFRTRLKAFDRGVGGRRGRQPALTIGMN